MPYANEHAARLKSPGQYDRFRRQNDKFGKGIDAIFGIKNGKAELQAIRFDASKFTAAKARKWLKDHNYKPIEFEPASKSESMEQEYGQEVEEMEKTIRVVEKGKPLEELVKGSMEYTIDYIRRQFFKQFPRNYGPDEPYYYPVDTFADHIVVSHSDLRPDEYYLVTYERDGEDYTFADMENWEVVELGYQPQTEIVESLDNRRFVESDGHLELLESEDGGHKNGLPRRVRGVGLTAGIINGNGRRYPHDIVEAAVLEAQTHLNESLGQGRLQILGEVEHPSSKGGRPNLLETVFKWEALSFDGDQVIIEGIIPQTSKGKDISALMESGVKIPLSQRAYGKSNIIKEGGKKIEEVSELHITGYDATLTPSDPSAGILETLQESIKLMDPEELKKLLEAHPELGVTKEQIDGMTPEQLKVVEETIKEQLGMNEDEPDDKKSKDDGSNAKKLLEELSRQIAINTAIDEYTKDLTYTPEAKKRFVESIKASKPQTVEAARELIEIRKREYDGLFSQTALEAMGYKQVKVVGPVLEGDLKVPAYARASFELSESLRKSELRVRRDLSEPSTPNEVFAQQYIEKFDEQHKRQLIREAREFDEAEAVSDLNLPYSVARAIIAEAMPTLISTGVFDFGMVDSSPFRLYYEAFSGETGYTVSISSSDNVTITALDTWYDMAYKRVTPGTVVVKNAAESTTYTEGTDYVIDYAGGRIRGLTGGSISALDVVHITAYTYTAIRKGEASPIERGKLTLTYKTLEAAADRLADQITKEAIVFSRSQLGWDATARTLANLIRQVRTKIDQGVIYLALSAALSVASNSGGTWTASTDPLSELVEKIGYSKVKVVNRYYAPTFVLLSVTNSDILSNSDLFSAAGQRPDTDLMANGYVGRIKGLACFQSTEMSDSYALVGNRELAMHRVFQTMSIYGPYPSYDVSGSTTKLVPADQYYVEEFNVTEAPVPQKGSTVKIA